MVAYLPLGGRGAGCWMRALFINAWGVHWVYNTPLLTCSNYFQQAVSSAGTVGEVVRCIIYKLYNPYFKKLCPQHQVIVKARFVVFVLHHYINNKVVYFFCHQNTRFCTHLPRAPNFKLSWPLVLKSSQLVLSDVWTRCATERERTN